MELEPVVGKRFGKNISKLLSDADVLKRDLILSYTITNKMAINIDVLGSSMED